jgi:hypothetical protein
MSIADRGVPNVERLHLSVLVPTNLINYAVFLTRRFSGGLKVPPEMAFWFSDTLVTPGDQVILYSGVGQNQNHLRPDGRRNWFVYWGLKNVIWEDPESCAVLLEINYWDTKF